MAIFHLAAQLISRAAGRSAVASAAYRSASRLYDERLGRSHDFTRKADLIHSAILLPADALDAFADRATLWNAVEAAEKRKDAQLAREVELALPHELADADAIELARAFVQEAFVAAGMIADLNLHKPVDAKGQAKPHAHVLLTLRAVGPGGFGPKVRSWNDRALLASWRELLAVRTNEALARADQPARVDHRSFAARGIDLRPQNKIGPAAARRGQRQQQAERAEEHRAIARANGTALLARPWKVLDYLTERQSTFRLDELARFVHRHTDGAEQFEALMLKVQAHPDLVYLGRDKQGWARFTTRHLQALEQHLAAHAGRLSLGLGHAVEGTAVERAAAAHGLGPDQRRALRHVTRPGGLALVVGYAGTGKSRSMAAAREVWEHAGYRVRGAALSGIAAEGLQTGSGIASRTLASWEHAWRRGRELLTARDVLVVDEAGMVGSRQLERVLAQARAAGAKVVLVGDPEQLQAIEAGAAFRALAERHGVAALTVVRRQRTSWMQAATRELATARTEAALARYEAAGMVHASETRDAASSRLIEQWDQDRRQDPAAAQLILAFTRADVARLNALARERLKASGELGSEAMIRTERGPRAMAVGERVMFLKNDRALGVRNGTLGVVRAIGAGMATVQLDADGVKGAGPAVMFALKDYAHLEHGYAATIHKSQSATVARSYALVTPHWDRHGTYVALSRHRDRVDVHHGRDDFEDRATLAARLGRERAKDTTLDYRPGLDAAIRAAIRAVGQRLQARAAAPVPLLPADHRVVAEVRAGLQTGRLASQAQLGQLRTAPARAEQAMAERQAARVRLSQRIREVSQRLTRERDGGRGR